MVSKTCGLPGNNVWTASLIGELFKPAVYLLFHIRRMFCQIWSPKERRIKQRCLCPSLWQEQCLGKLQNESNMPSEWT